MEAGGYFNWREPLVDESELRAAESAGSFGAAPAAAGASALPSVGGRPPAVVMDEALLRWLCAEGHSDREIAAYFGAGVKAVKNKKHRLGLTGLHAVRMPPLDVLQAVWEVDASTTVASAAAMLGVSCARLRRHMHAVGFEPPSPNGYDAVLAALQELLGNVDMRQVGLQFAMALLQTERRIIARRADVKRALRAHDPTGHQRRTREASKTQYVYNVAGPRSCYHCDAHEKLAKIWGFWTHLCIDGYSRRLIYLEVRTDKLADTVRVIFRSACDAEGWAARVRWDKGMENAGAIQEQLAHHARQGGDRWRGAAITGRSSQNCRAEYIWNFYKRHVSQPYRELFFRMMRETVARGVKLLDTSDPCDLFVLQAVFLPRIQDATARFRRMWNAHRIRGRRTVRGHGGGIPDELWLDPVEDRVQCDDEQYSTEGGAVDADGVDRDDEGCTYAVAEPFKGDTEELTKQKLETRDPLEGDTPLFALFRALRTAYFEAVSFAWDKDGVEEYREYWCVCRELLQLALHVDEGGVVDWDGWVGAAEAGSVSEMVRRKLAELGQ